MPSHFTTPRTPDIPGGPVLDGRVERSLPPQRSAAGDARDFITTTLRAWGLPGLIEDAALITTELFANALAHAPSPQYVLAIHHNHGKPRIELWDSGDQLPRKHDPGPDTETGRGLQVIEALSTAWGTHHATSGKCVWATL